LEKIEMKKTLVAVAALAAVSGAIADVTITGLVESSYVNNKTTRGLSTGQNGGSEVRFGGSEDLGNGLKATFQYTIVSNMGVEPASGTTNLTQSNGGINSYNSHVGLAGDFGSLKLGNQFTPYFLAGAATAAWGFSADSNNATAQSVRLNNSITYSTPSISGFTLAVQGDGANTNTSYSLTYAAGGLTGVYAYNKGSTNSTDTTLVGLSYDLGMAKLFLHTANGYLNTSRSKAATEAGVSIPMGAATLIASTASRNISGEKQISNVGITYDLSKRTKAYYLNTVNGVAPTANTALTAGSVTNILGISHSF